MRQRLLKRVLPTEPHALIYVFGIQKRRHVHVKGQEIGANNQHPTEQFNRNVEKL